MQLPDSWFAENRRLADLTPKGALILSLEERWLCTAACTRAYRWGITYAKPADELFALLRAAWEKRGATQFVGETTTRSGEGDGFRASVIARGRGQYVLEVAFPYSYEVAAARMAEIGATIKPFKPVVALALERGCRFMTLYRQAVEQDDRECAGLRLKGKLTLKEAQECVRGAGFRPEKNGIWQEDFGPSRVELGDAMGLSVLLNPQLRSTAL